MGQRADTRRALRSRSPESGADTGGELADVSDVVPASLSQQVVALLMATVLPLGGFWFLFEVATTPGKGEQVAPVLAIFVGVLFGVPSLFLLYRHLRRVFG